MILVKVKKKWCLMDQLSSHLMSYCSLVPLCAMIFLNEMIFSLICINSQPICNVINLYYETHMMILKWIEYNIRVIKYYFYFSFLLSTELKRWRESCVTMHCDEVHVTVFCDMWYVNKCCLKLSSAVPLCLSSNLPGTFDMLFSNPCKPGPVKQPEFSPVYLGQLLIK